MSLQRNDMLSTEGRAPRARRSCYVNEPAYGFFIAGSTIKPMNGVYIRKNPPARSEEEDEKRQDLLYYTHMDSPWTMILAETPETDESPYFRRSQGERSEWIFVDERSNEQCAGIDVSAEGWAGRKLAATASPSLRRVPAILSMVLLGPPWPAGVWAADNEPPPVLPARMQI